MRKSCTQRLSAPESTLNISSSNFTLTQLHSFRKTSYFLLDSKRSRLISSFDSENLKSNGTKRAFSWPFLSSFNAPPRFVDTHNVNISYLSIMNLCAFVTLFTHTSSNANDKEKNITFSSSQAENEKVCLSWEILRC